MGDLTSSLNRLLLKFQNVLGISTIVPSSKLYQLAESVAAEVSRLEDAQLDYETRNSLFSATGSDLDNIGNNIFGITRLKAERHYITSSMKTLKFYVAIGSFGEINKDSNGTNRDITIPAGTTVTGYVGTTSYTFRIPSEVVLSSVLSEKFIDAELISGGSDVIPSQTLTSHSFTNYTSYGNKLLLVTNQTIIGAGRSDESDNNYRVRITNSLRALATTSWYGIRNKALEVNGVSDVVIKTAASGGGSIAVFVQGTTPITGDEVISNVRSALAYEIPPWTQVSVYKPCYIGLEVGFIVYSKQNTESIIQSIIESVSSSINNFYGTEFYLNSLYRTVLNTSSNIYNVSIKYVNIYSGTDQSRMYRQVDMSYTSTIDQTIYLSDIDKLIVEPIVNAITVEFRE